MVERPVELKQKIDEIDIAKDVDVAPDITQAIVVAPGIAQPNVVEPGSTNPLLVRIRRCSRFLQRIILVCNNMINESSLKILYG
ncbi:hypothetical protein QL285_087003 [Trifolium repens]|nr:hypothetical protein QL285_087003 [Trifolium repens]